MDLLPAVAALAGVLGAAIGSFLNVVIYRVPRHESLLFPASHCPNCANPIRARHNVPVVGWLVLRGRCADCRAPISPRYPLVEAGTAALFVAFTLRLGVSPYLPAFLFLAAVGVALAMIDIDDQPLPHSMVLTAAVVGIGLLCPSGAADSWQHVIAAGCGGALVALVYLVVAISSHRAVDPGLALLAGLVGFALGWVSWLVVAVAASAALGLGLVARCALTTTGRRIGTSTLPLASVLLFAAGLSVLAPLPMLGA